MPEPKPLIIHKWSQGNKTLDWIGVFKTNLPVVVRKSMDIHPKNQVGLS